MQLQINHKHSFSRKTAYLGVFLSLALVCSYVEALIPFSFGVPGIKLGLANIVVVLLLYCVGAKEAIAVSVLRMILAGFLFGNAFSIVYSLAGGLLSFLVMLLLKKTNLLNCVSISVAGGISHNIGQLIAAAWIVENYNVFFYAPVLMIAGILTGFLIGILSQEIILRIGKRINF